MESVSMRLNDVQFIAVELVKPTKCVFCNCLHTKGDIWPGNENRLHALLIDPFKADIVDNVSVILR